MRTGINCHERDILQMLANGKMLKEISHVTGRKESALSLSVKRARDRVGGGGTTAGFVAFALRKGWIE
jgi:DNA-binding NarL/FixJ family response regulator